jgi:hypothetical protein
MLIAPRLAHLVHSFGSVNGNQAQWVSLKGYPSSDLGVLNVYAPHTP